ncbi:hypothetical protein JOD57_002828 [Geodermatophilus bullaregiensis]|uniref:hypothetical protein n=1 Tax=Geodermatophilus bullaregiensis TaxID=1564160 RepID=UPI00195DE109|nr:hypothetical protein [Geodermatophilus bullaregiensis]MBM7806991.1 hypothetical protein [Geodermatophilus bullaregiensis]
MGRDGALVGVLVACLLVAAGAVAWSLGLDDRLGGTPSSEAADISTNAGTTADDGDAGSATDGAGAGGGKGLDEAPAGTTPSGGPPATPPAPPASGTAEQQALAELEALRADSL